MKFWTLFRNREVPHEAFIPIDESRECSIAYSSIARLEALGEWDAALAKAVDTLAALHETPRPAARVFLIRSPRVRVYDMALYFKARGYRLKYDGRGFVEVVR